MNGVINPSRVHNEGCAASAASPRKVTFYCCVAPQLAASHPGPLPSLHDQVEESEDWTGLASLTSGLPRGGLLRGHVGEPSEVAKDLPSRRGGQGDPMCLGDGAD